MDIWETADLITAQQELGERYLEVLHGGYGDAEPGDCMCCRRETPTRSSRTRRTKSTMWSAARHGLQVGNEDREIGPGSVICRGDGRATSVSLDNGDADAAGSVRAAAPVAGKGLTGWRGWICGAPRSMFALFRRDRMGRGRCNRSEERA